MIRSRTLFLGLTLLLICALGIGTHFYRQIPALVQQELAQYLLQFGVANIEFEPPHISGSAIRVDALKLQGAYENLRYQAQLDSLELHYNWRTLLSGKVNSLTLAGLRMTVEETLPAGATERTSLRLSEAFPTELIEQLPMQTLQASNWNLDYHSPIFPALSVTGSLRIDDRLDLELHSLVGGNTVSVALVAATNPSNLDVNIALIKANADIIRLRANAEQSTNTDWHWQLDGKWQYAELREWLRELNAIPAAMADPLMRQDAVVIGKTAFTARIQHTDELQLADTQGSAATLLHQMNGSINTINEIEQINFADTFAAASAKLELTAVLRDGQVTMNLLPTTIEGTLETSQLSLPDDLQQWLGWKTSVPFRWENTEPVMVYYTAHRSRSLKLSNGALGIGTPDSRVDLHGFSLAVTQPDADSTQAESNFSTSVSVRLQQHNVPQLEVAVEQNGNLQSCDINLHLTDAAHNFRTDVKGKVNPTTGAGKYELLLQSDELPYVVESTLPLLQHLKLFTRNLVLDSGELRLKTTASSTSFASAGWVQRSQLNLQKLSGNISGYRVDDLSLQADWTGIREWRTLQPIEVSLAALNAGVAVHDVTLQLSLPKATSIAAPKIRIDRFSADMLGGQLNLSQPQFWDFAAPSNQLTVRAQQWQLSELVALQKNSAIQAHGTLEGELPLTIANGRVLLHNGYLRALPPGGQIRYTPDKAALDTTSSNAELALALNLLRDFQYQVLSSQVELDSSGNLLLGLSLSGSNPSQYGGQPINFNINLEQNIDPLLQSLRLSDTLVRQIEDGLQ
ncbi:MAG: YdbH domain-containing protein [Halioglobus sp.]